MTDKKYKIRDKKTWQFVDFITNKAEVICSSYGSQYSSISQAVNLLSQWQITCINNDRFIKLDRFVIEEYSLVLYNKLEIPDKVEQQILNKPDDEEHIKWLRAMLTQSVLDGFSIMNPDLLSFVLSYDKYKPILSEIVPNHIIQCIDEFMDVGILTCDVDVLGVLYLTASPNHVNMYDLDELCKCRTQNTS